MKNLILLLTLFIGFSTYSQTSNHTEVTKTIHPDYIEYSFRSNHASEPSEIRQHLSGFMDKYNHLIDITISDNKIVLLKVNPEFDENQTLKRILSRFRCPHYTVQPL